MCGAELRSGALVALLSDYALEPVKVHAVPPSGPRESTKVRALTDFLAAAFKARKLIKALRGDAKGKYFKKTKLSIFYQYPVHARIR